ncbi:hypothetical protein NRK99_13590 [Aeromonas dhakensis]|uniref:serine protease n=2 Tax=Aeromonas TaxID=642 RepID=UPI00227A72E0|nr:hypothetical protein [Aeromonas dhakensis]WAF71043.1 hypothetical protein NRK99_13590 [Aeromonas dhakensis]
MDLREVVFRIECGTLSGTAFFISKNRAITAYHNIKEHEVNDITCTLNCGRKIKANLSQKVTEDYKELDVALLELHDEFHFSEAFSFTNYNRIESGTYWISRGFPSAKKTSGDNILYGDNNIVNQQLNYLRNKKIDLELEHSKKLFTYSGYSGAPLVINNSISGIINQELLENGESKELTALSIKYFIGLLLSEGIDIVEKESSTYNPLRRTLSTEWFKSHIDKGIQDLGVRYTPVIHVKLDIENKIDALLKNEGFCEESRVRFHNYLLSINKLIGGLSGKETFKISTNEYFNQSTLINDINSSKDKIQRHFEDFCNSRCSHLNFYLLRHEAEAILKSINILSENGYSNEETKNASNASTSFLSYLDNPDVNVLLANNPYLLLKGKAGTGKSHLLADTIVAQQKKDVPAILLLGQHFTSDKSPWTQILSDILRIEGTEQQFLSALNEIGQERRQRVLFSIDAINEGKGKYFWSDHFISFVNGFKQYPWVCLVLTIRDTYLPKLVPKDIAAKTKIITANHIGFSGREQDAIKIFFNHYKINLPKIPYTSVEFSNPLFLKLFCEGLFCRGLHEIPEGYGGMSSIMNYFIDNIDEKLGHPKFYDYDVSGRVCRKIVHALTKYKQSNEVSYVLYDDACDIANKLLEKYSNKKGIIEDLVHEGFLSKNLYWLNDGQDVEGVYFAYERLDDHFLADFLAKNVITESNINNVFKLGGDLFYLIQKHYMYQGAIEALSIVLPELYGKELFEIVDEKYHENDEIVNAFINSLIWRKLDTIGEKTTEYVNNVVVNYEESFQNFLDFMYVVAGDVNHPYNANKLHSILSKMPLPIRDAEWTTRLKYLDEHNASISRLLEWVLKSDMHRNLSDDSALLTSISISWLLSSTTIDLRDKATYALSNILINRLNLGLDLIKKFNEIDDPYVHERIFAAVYGAVLNTDKLSDLPNLANYIVENVFQVEEVYPNVLIRDYARNIVEYALYKGEINLVNPGIIRPPYNSHMPSSFPSNEETDSYKFNWDSENFKPIYGSQNKILSSMVTEYGRGVCSYGDFGRYTFQSALNLWKEIDPNLLSNYACKLIFEKFGYNVDIHGYFDQHAKDGDRFENRIERIGKKYQWLSLYEVVARVADNFKVTDWNGHEAGYYQGPWQNGLRNIDPTFPPHKESGELPITVNNIDFDSWSDDGGSWTTSTNGLPDPKEMIVNGEFLSLEASFSWLEPNQLGIERENGERKQIWYQIRSYLVKEVEYENLKSWLETQDFMGRWLPESSENYSVFSKEHYWSPAYRDKVADNEELRWQSIKKNKADYSDGEIIAEVLPTAEEHRWDDKNGTSFLAPRSEMFEGMSLSSSEIPSCWFDNNGQLACFDPHVFGEERSELIVNRSLLENFLNNNNLKILWTVLGEKQVLGSTSKNNWIDISGVYYLSEDSVEGSATVHSKELGWKSKENSKRVTHDFDFDELLNTLSKNSD